MNECTRIHVTSRHWQHVRCGVVWSVVAAWRTEKCGGVASFPHPSHTRTHPHSRPLFIIECWRSHSTHNQTRTNATLNWLARSSL